MNIQTHSAIQMYVSIAGELDAAVITAERATREFDALDYRNALTHFRHFRRLLANLYHIVRGSEEIARGTAKWMYRSEKSRRERALRTFPRFIHKDRSLVRFADGSSIVEDDDVPF